MTLAQNQLENLFQNAGIDYSKPGFYDTPAFIEQEKRAPSFLEVYADYIDSMSFSPDYLINAKSVALNVTKFVYDKLTSDGQKGVCLDVCGIISRFLEKEGIWNYVIKGGLTISFDKKTRLSTTYCAPLMAHDNSAVLGHAWVVAPPFKVIDVAFSLQHYSRGEEKYLKGFIAEESIADAALEAIDIFDADAIKLFIKHNGHPPRIQDIKLITPGLVERAEKYGVFKVKLPDATLKYSSCGISFSEAPLEKVTNIKIDGKLPFELHKEYTDTLTE